MIASSDQYKAGGSLADARVQLARARTAYAVLAARVRAADPVLDHEVIARFDLLAAKLRKGVGPDPYRAESDALAGQLMDGVVDALVPAPAQVDRGLQAEVLRRVVTRMAATYDASAANVDPAVARLAFEDSWGLWRRAQALTSLIKSTLGSKAGTVSGTINGLRGSAFPDGPTPVDSPPSAHVDAVSTKLADALVARYALDR